jgi:TPR repeat protein
VYGARGEGVPRDDAEAARLYGLAAAQGHSFAQLALGGVSASGWACCMTWSRPRDYIGWRRRRAGSMR